MSQVFANQTWGSHLPTMKVRLEDETSQTLGARVHPKEAGYLQQRPVDWY
jgi:hypothetical protein